MEIKKIFQVVVTAFLSIAWCVFNYGISVSLLSSDKAVVIKTIVGLYILFQACLGLYALSRFMKAVFNAI